MSRQQFCRRHPLTVGDGFRLFWGMFLGLLVLAPLWAILVLLGLIGVASF